MTSFSVEPMKQRSVVLPTLPQTLADKEALGLPRPSLSLSHSFLPGLKAPLEASSYRKTSHILGPPFYQHYPPCCFPQSYYSDIGDDAFSQHCPWLGGGERGAEEALRSGQQPPWDSEAGAWELTWAPRPPSLTSSSPLLPGPGPFTSLPGYPSSDAVGLSSSCFPLGLLRLLAEPAGSSGGWAGPVPALKAAICEATCWRLVLS